ncbi:Phosphoglucomutase @ Phosphomannomutase, partial [hydrothermal vent metagenome]
MNRSIFREYDVRGVVEKDLTPELVEALGRAYGAVIRRSGGKKVVVGYDARPSSPLLFDILSRGITSTGIDVVRINVVPTPLMYFSIYHLETDGGVMITGSHNPPEFNGFKMNLGTGSLFGAAIQDIADMIEKEDYESGSGEISEVDVIPDYFTMVKSKIKLNRKIKIVIDAGNGCGGIFAPRLMRDLGCEVEELYCEVDGTFPNHHPDPTVPANLSDLIAKVKETGAQVGIAYDGDADR